MNQATPKAGPVALPELATYLTPFSDLFRRRWSRESMERYVTGLLTDLPHKTCDTIAEAIAGTTTERLQHLLTDADWDAVALDQARVKHLLAISPRDGLLAIDDTTFPKKGNASVGVAKQYCGVLGKLENCQTLVTLEYIADVPTSSTSLHWPVTGQLFLPEAWAQDCERRARAHVPETIPAQTKLELALELLDRAIRWEVRFSVVLADAGYGKNAVFLRGLEERELLFVCGVDRNCGLRSPEEVKLAEAQPYPARTQQRGRPRKLHPAPLRLAHAVIAALPDEAWQTITWREGSRGPMQRQFVALRTHWATGEAQRSTDDPRVYTSPECWLIAERPADGSSTDMRYYISNLPADTSLERLAGLVRARWPIEQFYEEAKQECGLGDYQGRRWEGFHRHVALVMLAYSFLVQQRMTEAEQADGRFSPSSPAAVTALHPPRSHHLASL